MKVKGSIGRMREGILLGWAFNEEEEDKPVLVEVFENGQLVEEVLCNSPRKSIKLSNIHSTGHCGFEVDLNNYTDRKGLFSFHINVKGSQSPLHNSPFILDNRKLKNRILIVGLNKSGTSILTFQIASGLKTKKIYFEPKGKENLNNYTDHVDFTSKDNIVTKTLYHQGHARALKQISALYDKKIWIVRDPRDVLISSYFYNWYKGHNQPEDRFKQAYEKTKLKEQNPQSLSFIDMTDGLINIKGYMKNKYQDLIDRIKVLDETWLVLKYEDLMDGKVEDLNHHLGFKIDTSASVSQKLGRVSRSNAYGNWRKWFIIDELPLLQEYINPALEQLGYDISDWDLQTPDSIDPKKGSQYMHDLFYGKIA